MSEDLDINALLEDQPEEIEEKNKKSEEISKNILLPIDLEREIQIATNNQSLGIDIYLYLICNIIMVL